MILEGKAGSWQLDGDPLAIGGQAAIYPARSVEDGHAVVVKVALVPGCPSVLAEGDRLRALAADPSLGPLVVPIWDEGTWDGRPFLVLERRPHTLASWTPGRPREARIALARQLVDAIAALQARGVVHGDVKPSNVLVDDGDPPALLLADFGGAAGGTAGTHGFSAPERTLDAPPDLASDRYSVAATVSWMLPDLDDDGVRAVLRALRAESGRRRPTLDVLADAFARPTAPRRWAPSSMWALAAVLGGGPDLPPCPAGFVPDGAACAGDVRLAWIPPGTYVIGRSTEDPSWVVDAPPRAVTLSTGIWMQDTEVTQGEWSAIMGSNPVIERVQVFGVGKALDCATWEGYFLVGDAMPVVCVGWDDAVRFANARSRKDGLSPAYEIGEEVRLIPGADGWRLPTEAEHEIAAKAGTRAPFPTDRDHLCSAANVRDRSAPELWGGEVPCDDGAPVLAPIRSYPPNRWGLYDLMGNAIEWTWDRYDPWPTGGLDPTGPATGRSRTQRGGSWNHVARGAAARYASDPADFANNFGFRLVRPAR